MRKSYFAAPLSVNPQWLMNIRIRNSLRSLATLLELRMLLMEPGRILISLREG